MKYFLLLPASLSAALAVLLALDPERVASRGFKVVFLIGLAFLLALPVMWDAF